MSIIKNGKKIAGAYSVELIPEASDSRLGVVRFATDEEVKEGSSKTTVVSPNQLSRFGGGGGGSNVLVDNQTIVKDEEDTITTVGVQSKNNVILFDWIGTEEEYKQAVEDKTIPEDGNWICWITDDEANLQPNYGSDVALLDIIITNQLLEGSEKIGKELQGSYILGNVYPQAYEKLAKAYSTGTPVTEEIEGTEVTYMQCSNGWKVLLAKDKPVYDALYEKTGSANFFVLDLSNGSFYLPKTDNLFQPMNELSKLNSYNAEGIPNITGGFYDLVTSLDNGKMGTARGCFYAPYTITANSVKQNAGTSVGEEDGIGFDASLSNPIYGNTEHVQQKSTNVLVYYKVANTVQSNALQIEDVVLNNPYSLFEYKHSNTELNNMSWLKSDGKWQDGVKYESAYNKLLEYYNSGDTNYQVKLSTEDYTDYNFVINKEQTTFRLPLLTTDRLLIARKEPTSEDGRWYNIYSDGWVEQGGFDTPVFTNSRIAYVNVSFLINMIDNNYAASAQGGCIASVSAVAYNINYKQTNTFKVQCICVDRTTAVTSATANPITWQVAGYGDISSFKNLNLYYYIGESVQGAGIINVERVELMKANTALDNLTAEGEKHFLNKNQITNCILEAPVLKKYEFNNGVLTFKTGNIDVYPNGFQEDGVTPKFDYVTRTDDTVLYTAGYTGATIRDLVLFPVSKETASIYNTGEYWYFTPGVSTFSGDTAPTSSYSNILWYDTANNIIKHSLDGGTNWEEGETIGLPAMEITLGTQTVVSVNEIFDNISFCGSTIVVYKDLKLLYSIGRNNDKTLKNKEVVTDKEIIRTWSGLNAFFAVPLFILDTCDGMSVQKNYVEGEVIPDSFTGIFRDTYNNTCQSYISGVCEGLNYQKIALVTTNSKGMITNLKALQPISLAKEQDLLEVKENLDGNWVSKYYAVFQSRTFTAKQKVVYSLASYLPNDGNKYEVLLTCYIRTGTATGNATCGAIYSSLAGNAIRLCRCVTRTANASAIAAGTATVPVGTDREITWFNIDGVGTSGSCGLFALAYRKVR